MTKYSTFLVLSFLLIFAACGKQDKENIDNVENSEGGRCKISKDLTVVMCIEYPDSVEAEDAEDNCEEYKNLLGSSVNGFSYESGKNSDCAHSNELGSCANAVEADGTIYYYSDSGVWNATTAEDDCTDVAQGTWTSS